MITANDVHADELIVLQQSGSLLNDGCEPSLAGGLPDGTNSVQRFLRAHERRNPLALEAEDEIGMAPGLSNEMDRYQLELLAERYEELLEENDE